MEEYKPLEDPDLRSRVRRLIRFLLDRLLTIGLILINILVYLLQDMDDFQRIIDWANFSAFTLDGQPHRLLTSMFMHGNFLHLLLNMYNLFYLGGKLEREVGVTRLLEVYFISGFLAGLVSIWLNLFTFSIGASGAIYGLYAFEFIRSFTRSDGGSKMGLIVNFIFLVFFSLSFGESLQLDNAAHLGGFVGGDLLPDGCTVTRLVRYGATVLLTLVTLVLYTTIPRHQVDYYHAFQYSLEQNDILMEVLLGDLSGEDYEDHFNRVFHIPDSIINKFQSLSNVPEKLRGDTAGLIRFYQIRRAQLDFEYKEDNGNPIYTAIA